MRLRKTGRRIFALLIVVLIGTKISHAQSLDIVGGIGSSGISHKIAGTSQDNTGKFGFNVGLAVFAPFKPKAYKKDDDGSGINATLHYVTKGTSKSTAIAATKADLSLKYLQLNIPVAYRAVGYGVGVGPYVAYALSGSKQFNTGNTNKQAIDFGTDLKRFDYGIGVELQLSLFKFFYDLGLANIGNGVNTVKTRNFGVNLVIPLVE